MNKGWSLNEVDWGRLKGVLDSRGSWTRVLLTKTDESLVPEQPGVYALCARPPIHVENKVESIFNSLIAPLYVGRSETSLRSRFRSHRQSTDQRMVSAKQCYSRISFWFIVLPSPAVLAVEAHMIQCFGPPVNSRAGTIPGTLMPPIDA